MIALSSLLVNSLSIAWDRPKIDKCPKETIENKGKSAELVIIQKRYVRVYKAAMPACKVGNYLEVQFDGVEHIATAWR